MDLPVPEKAKLSQIRDSLEFTASAVAAQLRLWNFSDRAEEVRVEAEGATFEGLEQSFKLEPFGMADVPIVIGFPEDRLSGELAFRAVGSDGRKSTVLSVPVMQYAKVGGAGIQTELDQMMDPHYWRGKMLEFGWNEADQCVEMNMIYPSGTHPWFYPTYELQLPQENLRGAYGVAFEVQSDQAFSHCYFQMIVDEPGKPSRYVEIPFPAPSKEWQERTVVFGAGDPPEHFTKLMYVLNPKDSGAAFRMRNFRVIRLD